MTHRLFVFTSLLVVTAPLAGCYGMITPPSLAPDFGRTGASRAVGRDCAFHLGGLPSRELDAPQALRHALRGRQPDELSERMLRVVYPAPFEVCVEVSGVLAPPFATKR